MSLYLGQEKLSRIYSICFIIGPILTICLSKKKQINGIDVTCKTHYECVKLIKKTGDTLALKVYTVSTKPTQHCFTNSNNLTSTSSCGLYQTPSVLTNHSNNAARSQSYYAASSITSTSKANMNLMNNEYHQTNVTTHTNSNVPISVLSNNGISLSTTELNSYMDRTKSLPSKKKRKFSYAEFALFLVICNDWCWIYKCMISLLFFATILICTSNFDASNKIEIKTDYKLGRSKFKSYFCFVSFSIFKEWY